MFKLFNVLPVIFTLNLSLSGAINRAPDNNFSARQLGQTIAQCLGDSEFSKCFENKLSKTLDLAIANNENWPLNDYLVIEKTTSSNLNGLINNTSDFDELPSSTSKQSQQDTFKETLVYKMLQLAQARSLRIQLPSSSVGKLLMKRSISSTFEDRNANANEVDSENFAANVQQQLEQEEGRKKKNKDKHMAMMGGMTILAMVAQMFLGKVILIAGTAFIMAKVALLISTLGSLKKGTSGSGVGTDHVIVTGGGGVTGSHSHEHISSWHRRTPYEYNKYDKLAAEEQKFIEPIKYYEAGDISYLKKRHPYQNLSNQNTRHLNKINLK